MEKYNFCIVKDESDIIEYEKGLFKSFSEKDPDGWLAKNYQKIDNCRLKSNIPYIYQEVYCVKMGNKIVAGSAVNYNKEIKMQFEEMGFKISQKDKDKNICDGLNMYFLDSLLGEDFMNIGIKFGDFVLNELKKKNIDFWYGTCSKKLKSMYVLYGWEFIDKKIIDNTEKLFIKFDVKGN